MMAKNTIEMLSYAADSMSKTIYPHGEDETVKVKTEK
jgi:hypothetical protein